VEYDCWSAYDYNDNKIIDASDLAIIGDANTDGNIDRLDLAFEFDCPYDIDDNGVIDATEFDNWLTLNQRGI